MWGYFADVRDEFAEIFSHDGYESGVRRNNYWADTFSLAEDRRGVNLQCCSQNGDKLVCGEHNRIALHAAGFLRLRDECGDVVGRKAKPR